MKSPGMAFKNKLKLCLLIIHFCTVYQCFFIINNYAHRADYKIISKEDKDNVRNDKENHPVRYN